MNLDETTNFWINEPIQELANRCAVLHTQRRELQNEIGIIEVNTVRRIISSIFIKGIGIEVGAGTRPFYIQAGSICNYGDIRDENQLNEYFDSKEVKFNSFIDAQTMLNVPVESVDFVISAHVIEHLFDPIGAIVKALNVIKKGGIFLLVVPEKSKTWDHLRPATTLEHLILDYADEGQGTKFEAYIEHAKYVHPDITGSDLEPSEINEAARRTMEAGMDIHVHSWLKSEFYDLIIYCKKFHNFIIEHVESVQNENIFVLRKR